MSLVGFKAQNHGQQVNKRGALDKVDDRRTPRVLWDELNKEFKFTLDVAASTENALCYDYFDIRDNGLENDWAGSVWCNPPYSNIGQWVDKASKEIEHCDSIVMLLPANRTEQGWWQDYIEPYRGSPAIETRFLRGRLRFDTPEGTYSDPRGNRPPFGCVLVIWRRIQKPDWFCVGGKGMCEDCLGSCGLEIDGLG